MDVTGVPMVLNITNLELAKFIGTTKGEQVSRLQVIKKLVAHLKETCRILKTKSLSFLTRLLPKKQLVSKMSGIHNVVGISKSKGKVKAQEG